MGTFYYRFSWSPYLNVLQARNYEDAWKQIKKMFLEYNVKKCCVVTRGG
jgi:hypothetical protein